MRAGISLNGSPVFWKYRSGTVAGKPLEPANRHGPGGINLNGYVQRLEILDGVDDRRRTDGIERPGLRPNVIVGTLGADRIFGTAGDDVIFGDRLFSKVATKDVIRGLQGDDKFYTEPVTT